MHKIKLNRIVASMLVATGLAFSAAAGVLKINEPITVDGDLAEGAWKEAKWEGGFERMATQKATMSAITGPTSFAVLSDERNVYVGVKAVQADMAALKAKTVRPIFQCDDVEFFFSPSGSTFSFYQFAVGIIGGVDKAIFHYEAGMTHPDPYAPEWKHAVKMNENGYTMEVAIPLSAFYMNRNDAWSDQWLFNVSRSNFSGCHENTTWSPIKKSFLDVEQYRKFGPFPLRRAEDDVCMREAIAEIKAQTAAGLEGELKVKAFVAKPGVFVFESANSPETEVALKRGENTFRVKCTFPKNATHDVAMTLTRQDDGTRVFRRYPVYVDFQPIRAELTTPGYANNFYPGQCTDQVKGRVSAAVKGELKLTMEGEGFAKRELTLPEGGGEFAFDTKGFKVGSEAYLTVKAAGADPYRVRVRSIAPNGHRMAWIDHGSIIIDGKPTFRRNFYAGDPDSKGKPYCCTEHFMKRMRVAGFDITPEVNGGGTIETGRLLGNENEARKDEPPSKELLAKVDEVLEKAKDKDFVYYYLCDEPECRSVSPVYLKYVYDYVKAKDPYHLILIVSRAADRYIKSCDWIESHGYLNPYYDEGVRKYFTPMNRMGAFLEGVVKMGRQDKVIGMTPQIFSYPEPSDYPTFDEYVCNIWTYLVNGGKTLYPFIFHNMGDRPSLEEAGLFTFATIASLEDILLMGERTLLVRNADYESALWEYRGETLFTVVNLTEKPQTAKVKMPKGDERVFKLKPFEVVVESNSAERREKMPKYAEAAAKAAAREKERLSRDNQLLERHLELQFACSNPHISKRGLVDGVLDNHTVAGDLRGSSNWLEIAFPKKAIEFKTVKLWGEDIDKTTLKARVKGEWKELTPVKRDFDAEGGCLTFEFGEVVKTVKIRFEFHQDHNQPTEIEIPYLDKAALKRRAAQLIAGRTDHSPSKSAGGTMPVPPVPVAGTNEVVFSAANADYQEGWTGEKWYGRGEMRKAADGSSFTYTDGFTHAFSYKPEYRWLDFTVLNEHIQKDGGYKSWGIMLRNYMGTVFGNTHCVRKGLYTMMLNPLEAPINDYLMINTMNYDITMGYIRFSHQAPATRFAVWKKGAKTPHIGKIRVGDTLVFRLVLEEPCEEVSCKLEVGNGNVPMPVSLNRVSTVDLKCLDGEGCRWGAEVEVKDLVPTRYTPVAEVTTLGNGEPLVIYTRLPGVLFK